MRGDLKEGFLHYKFGGFIFGGAYTSSLEGLIFAILRYNTIVCSLAVPI